MLNTIIKMNGVNITSLDECFESNSPFCKIVVDNSENSTIHVSKPKVVRQFVPANQQKLSEIYNAFVQYYGNPMCSKYKFMGNNLCAYISKMRSSLGFGSRVIVVVVPEDRMVLGSLRSLQSLHWINFQTRHLEKELQIQEHVIPTTKTALISSRIERYEKTDLKSDYFVENYPELKLSLHRKKESIQDWSSKNMLYVALETYCCSVYIN